MLFLSPCLLYTSGGGMTYTFKAALGGHVGSSICEADKLDLALDIMRIAKEKGVNLVLSDQAVIADGFSNDANTKLADPMNIPDGWEGLDIGCLLYTSLAAYGSTTSLLLARNSSI